jgi:hypothetical protein
VTASRRIEAGESCLSVPLSLGLLDTWEEHPVEAQEAVRAAPWFARLACRLLQERKKAEQSNWASYLLLVPETIANSPLCDTTLLAELRSAYPPLHSEAEDLCQSASVAYAQLSATPGGLAALAGADYPAFARAVAVTYSRAYGLSAGGEALCRVMLPLADLLNHGGDEHGDGPTWPPVSDSGCVRWEMVEGELQISAVRALQPGEEALFSYREQSNDNFLIYYGFVPARNAHDDVVLFGSLDEALSWLPYQSAAELASARAAVERLQEQLGGSHAPVEARRILVLSGGRLDNRLVAAYASLLGSRAAAFRSIVRRCEELRAQLAAGIGARAVVAELVSHKIAVLDDALVTLQSALAEVEVTAV